MKSKQFVEAVKTAVIVFLFASALFLGGKSGIFNEFLGSVPAFARAGAWITSVLRSEVDPGIIQTNDPLLLEAARPVGIVLTFGADERYGVRYDSRKTDELYDQVASLLGESLGSAAPPVETDERQWKAALLYPGIFFEFDADIPLVVLTRWLGQEMRSENIHSARRIYLADRENDTLELYYIDETGLYYTCATAAKLSGTLSSLDLYAPNGARFAYEYGPELRRLDPYTVLLSRSSPKLLIEPESLLYVSIPAETLLAAVAFNPRSKDYYNETEDTLVYVEDSGRLKITAQGLIEFSANADSRLLKVPYAGSGPEAGDLIEAARRLLDQIRTGSPGDETLMFTELRFGQNRMEVAFNYYVNGARVIVPGGDAAVVTLEDGYVTAFRLLLRGYRLTDIEEPMIPEYQAAALAQEMLLHGALVLVYPDAGGAYLAPQWIADQAGRE